jgi:hypothetical protein
MKIGLPKKRKIGGESLIAIEWREKEKVDTCTTVGGGSSSLHCSASFFKSKFAFFVDIVGCVALGSAKSFRLWPKMYLQ